MSWSELESWWLEELASDPAYLEEIEPLLLQLLDPGKGKRYLDLGCGDGRLLRVLHSKGSFGVGCDLNHRLLSLAAECAPVVQARLPDLRWIQPATFHGAFCCLVLEHLADEECFFAGVASAVRRGGCLALVINHPVWTAPKSSPIQDASGEMLWRSGRYFGRGHSDEVAGDGSVRFYHRTMAALFNAASVAGWDLERLEERGVSEAQQRRFPEYEGQEHIPRLLGARWRRR